MRRTIMLLTAALAISIAMPLGAQAASPHQVDPAGMTPPLNPSYGPWICTDTGGGPICRGSLSDAWTNADSELRCGDDVVYTTGDFHADAVRWHLPDGRATHTFFKKQTTEVWTLSSTGAGPSVKVRGSWNLHYVYPDPGDRSTRVLTTTGADWQVTAKGYGLVFHDTGLVRFVPGTDDVIDFTHGPTDSDHGNLDLVMPEVCAILEG
jgi:hypothetical protein